jgi:hypothetical protein
MWIDLKGLIPWKMIVPVICAFAFLVALSVGIYYLEKDHDERMDHHNKTKALCQDKVKVLKLKPAEMRTAYDLCKETDGRLP